MKKRWILCLVCCLVPWPLAAGELDDATLQMRYRLGQSLRQEMDIGQELERLQGWLGQARQEEEKLKSNLDRLGRMQHEISRELPGMIVREKQANEQMAILAGQYHSQLRAIYLYAPEAEEWFFADEREFGQALNDQRALEVLLKARLENLRLLRARAADLELSLASLRARQRQMHELADQMQLTQADLAALGERRASALEEIARQREQLRQNQTSLAEAQSRLERAGGISLPSIGASQAPATGALAGRGSFFAPVPGRLLNDRRGHFSLLESQPGSQVRAPWAGVAAFVDYVPGYGRVAVIDHGERLYTVMAHLRSTRVDPGQMLSAGQVLGQLDDSGLLYLEIRLAAKPQPASSWLFMGSEP